MNIQERKKMCDQHLYRYVEVKTADGSGYDGIVERVDDHWLCLAVPLAVEPYRFFFPYPYWGGGSRGAYYAYPRRFTRLIVPLAALTALNLLPYYR